VPCGDKPEVEKEAIRAAGDLVLRVGAIIYLSRRMLRVYRTKVLPLLREHHPLPRLQAGLVRTVDRLIRSQTRCRLLPLRGHEELQYALRPGSCASLHVLERSRVERYDVSGLGLRDEEDMEVLRVALAAASKEHEVLLVSVDRHFLEDLRVHELRARYPDEGERTRIMRPSELIVELQGI